MFERLTPLLIAVRLLLWILDYLGLLDVVSDALRLVLTGIVGKVKLAAFLIRKLVSATNLQS